jgi:hypothetical protein
MKAGRSSEARQHSTWDDTDPEDLSLRITSKPHLKWSSKSHQERTVIVAPAVFEWLSAWRAKAPWPGDDDFIFATRLNQPRGQALSGSPCLDPKKLAGSI